jgi:hypothetical protein
MSLNIQNFSYSEITDSIVEKCISDLNFLYADNKYLKPGLLQQQTNDILFDGRNPRFGEHWNLLKNTFLESAKKYSGEDATQYKAWVFACFPQKETMLYDWHEHPYARFSGVMYLSLPEGSYTTEFINEDKTTFFLPNRTKEWFMFQKNYTHRNGYWEHSKMNSPRYCLAASIT